MVLFFSCLFRIARDCLFLSKRGPSFQQAMPIWPSRHSSTSKWPSALILSGFRNRSRVPCGEVPYPPPPDRVYRSRPGDGVAPALPRGIALPANGFSDRRILTTCHVAILRPWTCWTNWRFAPGLSASMIRRCWRPEPGKRVSILPPSRYGAPVVVSRAGVALPFMTYPAWAGLHRRIQVWCASPCRWGCGPRACGDAVPRPQRHPQGVALPARSHQADALNSYRPRSRFQKDVPTLQDGPIFFNFAAADRFHKP